MPPYLASDRGAFLLANLSIVDSFNQFAADLIGHNKSGVMGVMLADHANIELDFYIYVFSMELRSFEKPYVA